MAIEELQNSRYKLLRLLGTGGMGEVYLMEDMRVNRQVAIKVIRSEGAAYPDSHVAKEAARLFQREARAIAALEHPNILPLYDFGEEVRDGTTMTYIVMPFCTEGTLADWLRQRSSATLLSPLDIVYLVEQAAEGLQNAHDHHVIHLDVKPSNFLLRTNTKNRNRPFLLLADFGVARSSATVANSSRTIRGTPTSMAPEQWGSSPVPATDQYALAVMAYELLTGRPPFIGSMEQLMYQHFSAQPLPPSTFNSRLPAAMDSVILRALAKKPEDRFPTITAFAAALEQAAQTAPAEFNADRRGSDISQAHTILAISPAAAASGISQIITLPGGQHVAVAIPAGAYNGQIIRVPDPSKSSSADSEVVLTVAIKQSEEALPLETPPNTPKLDERVLLAEARVGRKPPGPVVDHDLPTVATSGPAISAPEKQPLPPPKRPSALRFGIIAIISVLVILFLLVGMLFYFNNRPNSSPSSSVNHLAQSQTATALVKHQPTPLPTATATPRSGLYIAGTYSGTMVNETSQQATSITVYIVQTKGEAPLSGSVTFKSPPQGVYLLNGTVDLQGNFSFSVRPSGSQTPLLFYGAVQQGTYLHGNYCSSSTSTCLSVTGYFTAGPRS